MKRALALALLLGLVLPQMAYAKWVWSRETGFYNPKYAIKATAEEQLEYARSIYDKGNYDHARKLYKRVILFFPDSEHCAEAQFMTAECYFKDKDYYRAYKAYEVLRTQYPKNKRIQEVIDQELDIGVKLCTGTKRKWIGGIPIKAEGKGIEILENVIRLDSWSDKADDALLEIGKCQYRRNEFDAAGDTFQRVLENYPSSEHVADAQFRKGMSALSQDQGPEYDPTYANEATRDFKRLKEDFAGTEPAKKAGERITQMEEASARSLFETVKYYVTNNKYPAAAIYLRSLAREYPGTSYGDKAARIVQVLDTLETPEQ